MKYVKVLFSNGEKFSIPAGVIANNRAKYYADHDEGKLIDGNIKAWNKVFYDELKNTLDDDSELLDWLWNNMNWKDVKEHAEKVEDTNKDYDYEEHWTEISENESNVEIVEE